MNFNEKLIELRKKEGLSQEELGYKLNVTRQTISKWELGQTTPDMDKLSEISNFFGISIDNLLNEEEIKTTDNPIKEETTKNNSTLKVVILIVIITIIFLMILCFGFISKIRSDKKSMIEEIFNKGIEKVDEIQNKIEETEREQDANMTNTITTIIDKVQNELDTSINETDYTNQKEEYEKAKDYIEQQSKETQEEYKKIKSEIEKNS